MSDVKYTYAVARIRAMEMSLFNSAMIEQLLAMKDYDACLQFLAEKGWGDPDTPMDAEAILSRESEKTWSAVRELIRDDASVLDVLFYPNLFHNLKAAIKESVTGKSHGKVYFDDCSIDPKEMLRIIQDRDYLSLPENMRAAAKRRMRHFFIRETGSSATSSWTGRAWRSSIRRDRRRMPPSSATTRSPRWPWRT